METDGSIDLRKAFRQFDGGTAGGEIRCGDDDKADTGIAGSRKDGVDTVTIIGIEEMSV